MKKYLDKLKSNIYINKNLFIFLLVIVIVGVVAGSVFATIIDQNDKKMVLDYLNSFFTNVKTNKLNYDTSIINTLLFTVGFATIIWLLGISVVGFIVVIFMLFLKAFVLGFSLSGIIINFKVQGVLYGFTYIFPHQIINILVFMLLSAYALMISYKLINCLTSKKPLYFKNIINKYLMVLGISVVVLMLTSLYEVYVMPNLLNIVMSIIK